MFFLKISKNARDICDRVQNLQELKAAVEAFDGCSLKLTSNKTIFGSGNPDSKIMIIGEAPNGDEDRMGELFVGKSGQLLDNMLSSIELDRSCCYISNILPWRPPGNRVPTETEVAVCLPFIKKQIELISPNIILILGGSAANNLLDNDLPISKLRGKWMEYKPIKGDKIDVLASFHPDYLLKNPAQKAKIWADLLKLSKKC